MDLSSLRPGEHLVVFIEDSLALRGAGFEIRDCFLILMPGPSSCNAWLVRKPPEGTLVNNILKHQTGALNLDACRVGQHRRWSTNVLLVHDKRCADSCVERCPVKHLDEMSGILTSGVGSVKKDSGKGYRPNALGTDNRAVGTTMISYGDTGTASRYYPQFKSTLEMFAWLQTLVGV